MRKIAIVFVALLCSSLFHPRLVAQDHPREDSVRSQLASVERELEALVALAKKEDSAHLEAATRLLRDARKLKAAMTLPSAQGKQISVEMKFLEFEDGTDDFSFAQGSIQGLKMLSTDELEMLVSRSKNVISAPRVLVVSGRECSLIVEDEQEYAVLERDDDRRYSMHTVKAKEGIDVKLAAAYEGSDRPAPIHIRLTASVERVVGRSPCTGNARQVGMPLIGTAARELDLVIGQDRWIAARLPLPGAKKGGIVLVLRAMAVK